MGGSMIFSSGGKEGGGEGGFSKKKFKNFVDFF